MFETLSKRRRSVLQDDLVLLAPTNSMCSKTLHEGEGHSAEEWRGAPPRQ